MKSQGEGEAQREENEKEATTGTTKSEIEGVYVCVYTWDACSIRKCDTDKCSCVTVWLFFLTQRPCAAASFHSQQQRRVSNEKNNLIPKGIGCTCARLILKIFSCEATMLCGHIWPENVYHVFPSPCSSFIILSVYHLLLGNPLFSLAAGPGPLGRC